jgi:GH25 family lysozyme M1 (1,4-beta-N-acetylmuramidase)
VRFYVSLRSAGVCALLASLGALGLTGAPATATAATAGPGLATSGPPPNRSNVGATHSPQLLQQLAGPAGATRTAIRAGINQASVTGALQGVDVASFQHPKNAAIDWTQVAGAGIQFAAVKATEGNYYKNPFAPADLADAQAAGLSVIAYAFGIPNGNGGSKSPAVQADYLLSYLGASNSGVPVLLDIEYDPYVSTDGTNSCYGLSQSAMVNWIAGFDSEVQAKTGRLPIIYTTANWWSTCTGNSTAFGQTPMWVANFTTAASPALPAGWADWSFWQYTSAGTVAGISTTGATDLDQLNPALVPLLGPGARGGAGGTASAFGVSLADPVSGQTPSFSATGLPPGMSIGADGTITGWLGTPGTYHPAVTATAGGASGSVSFTWTVTTAPSQGPAGAVRLTTGGKCLNDVGNKSANGTQADIWTCNGSTAQQWTYVKDGTLRIHGKCLVPPGSSPASGAKVVLATCTGAPVQQWWLTYPRSINSSLGAIPITLRNPASGMCLSDTGFSTGNGTRVVVGSCNGFKNQAWTLPAGPVSSQIPGMCMDDSGNQTANGTKIDIWSCNGGSSQQWTTGPDGTVRIHGKCLDAEHGGTASGTPVDLSTCQGTGAQQWQLVPSGGGASLMNPQSGLCLADPGNATVNGTGLQIATCAGAAGQAWRAQ